MLQLEKKLDKKIDSTNPDGTFQKNEIQDLSRLSFSAGIVSLFLLLLLCIILLVSRITLAMPPSPEILDKIKNNDIKEPYFLKNISLLRSDGINSGNGAYLPRGAQFKSYSGEFNILTILVGFADKTAVTPSVFFDSLIYNDNDGYVDGIIIVHAGPGAEFTGENNDIWSHQWTIPQQSRDGVIISSYTTMPEYWENSGDMTIDLIPTTNSGTDNANQSQKSNDIYWVSSYPNPFNIACNIVFTALNGIKLNLKFFNIRGEEVRILVDDNIDAGTHQVIWDGTNERGNNVASGYYYYVLRTSNNIISKSITLIK
ncbi:MAG: hypothetical protein GY855_09975 [candidate division Zixibacteria bacterium]|nr:hypothetical protein [candidate division Zixibacteria bacterium]